MQLRIEHGRQGSSHRAHFASQPATILLPYLNLRSQADLKIDLHTHILPKDWPDLHERYGYGGWVKLDHYCPGCARMMIDGEPFREIKSNCWDTNERLNDCDHHGSTIATTTA